MSHAHFAESSTVQGALDRYLGGDESALDELLGHCRERLRGLVHQRLAGFPDVRADPINDTSDVLNEGLMRIDRAVTQLRPATALDLFRLAARNIRWVLLDLAKKVPPGRRVDAELLAEHPDRPTRPESALVWDEFHKYLEELPGERKELFDLLYYDGLTITQAAEVLNRPRTTVSRQWMEARVAVPPEYIPLLGDE
jgi:RNA polymerase sigma factor (sigma-70 family)